MVTWFWIPIVSWTDGIITSLKLLNIHAADEFKEPEIKSKVIHGFN
jgi:hypothetical protein